MATVLRPNSFFSGVIATDRFTRSKKLMMTPMPSSTAIRQRRLVHSDGDAEVKEVRWAGKRDVSSATTRRPENRYQLATPIRSPIPAKAPFASKVFWEWDITAGHQYTLRVRKAPERSRSVPAGIAYRDVPYGGGIPTPTLAKGWRK